MNREENIELDEQVWQKWVEKVDPRTGHGDAVGVSSAALPRDWCCWQVEFLNGLAECKSHDPQGGISR